MSIYDKVIGVNPGGLGGSRPPDFGRGSQGIAEGSWGRGRVVKYYLIMYSTTGSMFESGDF